MTATRLATATLVALVALTCDITDVEGPPADSPDAEPWLTAEDLPVVQQVTPFGLSLSFRGNEAEIRQQMIAYLDLLRAQPRAERAESEREPEDEREPGRLNDDAGLRIVAQTIVESDSPSEADLVLADEPLLRVGMLDGPDEYIFSNIAGALRLVDGRVVVADEQSREVRMYDGGRHLWTSGREGEGPGEYKGLWLTRGCPVATVTTYDLQLKRITELDSDGKVVDTRALRGAGGPGPYGVPACSPGGDVVFTDWPDTGSMETLAVGAYRWEMSLSRERDDGVDTLRSGIPGRELYHHGGGIAAQVTWGKEMAFAVTATGVWHGSADDYELEHVDWNGHVTRVARWTGPNLEVTREHLTRYRDTHLARYETAEERRGFERERRPEMRDGLPKRFPAYSSNGLLPLPDGSVWVVPHSWRDLEDRAEFHLLGPDGTWLHRLMIPSDRTLLDAGPGWVLLLERGEFDEQSVAVYELVEGS